MKMYPRLIATVAACLWLASVAAASAQDERVRAQVPFGFAVGETTFPSGTYEVSRVHAETNVLIVRGADREEAEPSGRRIGERELRDRDRLRALRPGDRPSS